MKFSDDTALVSLLFGSEQSRGPALDEFVEWCDMSFLELNVMKTKEMVFDFRTHKDVLEATLIHDQEVEVVSQYKYLGTVMDDKLRWDANTEAIAKKGQQRLYFLQKLNSFSVDTKFLTLFYKSFIESIITFSFICWFGCLGVNKNSLQKIVNVSSKVIGEPQRNLQDFFVQQDIRKASSILGIHTHILQREFERLPSGRRFRANLCKTNRRKFSFIPTAISLLNENC